MQYHTFLSILRYTSKPSDWPLQSTNQKPQIHQQYRNTGITKAPTHICSEYHQTINADIERNLQTPPAPINQSPGQRGPIQRHRRLQFPQTTRQQPTTMVSFRSLIAPSTGLFRQFLRKPLTGGFLARSFSQLTTLSLTNGLRALRAGKEQAGNVSVASTVRQLDQIRGMKTRSSVKRLCDGCKV